MTPEEITLLTQGGIAAVVMVVVQILKNWLETKWLQVASVVTGGVLGGLYALYQGQDPVLGALAGFMSGAAATGLYGAVKNPMKSE